MSFDELDYDGEDMSDSEAAVAKGAALLDKILPGWHKQIDLEKLDMGEPSICMMGQLFGTAIEGQLAREMYPKEMEDAIAYAKTKKRRYGTDGYTMALCYGPEGKGDLIHQLMNKTGRGTAEEYAALDYVCSGHDTRCLWAEEIATRIAKESDGKEPLSK